MRNLLLAVSIALGLGAIAAAAETPKRGGTLTYVIAAEGVPHLDAHIQSTYALLHATAPFYSTLMQVNPENPTSTTDFVCDLCTGMPQPADNGLTYTFKIREGVRFHDGTPLTAHDVATSWRRIVFPPTGIASPRRANFLMVDRIEDPDATTVIFRLKFPTLTFIPALATPWSYIYSQALLEKDQHYFERNVIGSGPFRFAQYDAGRSISGLRNADYYRAGQPYLDGFRAIFIANQQDRVDAVRSDRAALEFRGESPTVRDQLVKELGEQVTVQESDWNCGNVLTPNHTRKPFDDPRVRRALFLAIDQWNGAKMLSETAIVRTVGGIVFPGSPLAATRDELIGMPSYSPDIEKSRAEARQLLHDAGADGLSFELLNRNVDQPYLVLGAWLIEQFRTIGVCVTQKVIPTGGSLLLDTFRTGDFAVALESYCQDVVNPIADISRYLPHKVQSVNFAYHDDAKLVGLYDQMLRATDPTKARVLMREFERQVIDVGAHQLPVTWWYRILPIRSYVKGWNIASSHYLNQNLANIWLDR